MSSTIMKTENKGRPMTLGCFEIWGGNNQVSHALEMPGLKGWLHSEPAEQSLQGGDVHCVSVCSKGVLTRLALADVSGHGQSAGSVAEVLRSLIHKHIETWDQSELMRDLITTLQKIVTQSKKRTAIQS